MPGTNEHTIMDIHLTNYFMNIQKGLCLDQELYTPLLVLNSKELFSICIPKQTYVKTYSINRCHFKPKMNMG